jgi:hypothetical protein
MGWPEFGSPRSYGDVVIESGQEAKEPASGVQTPVEESADTPSPNPIAASMPLTVSIPSNIKIELVEVHSLSEYELWFFISSILFGIFTGFYIDYLNLDGINPRPDTSTITFIISMVFLALAIFAIGETIAKRRNLKGESTVVPFAAQLKSPDNK